MEKSVWKCENNFKTIKKNKVRQVGIRNLVVRQQGVIASFRIASSATCILCDIVIYLFMCNDSISNACTALTRFTNLTKFLLLSMIVQNYIGQSPPLAI